MIARTKKHKIENNEYIKLGMWYIVKDWWWVWLIPVGIMLLPFIFIFFGAFWTAFFWCLGITIVAIILYLLFWGAQFAGYTQHPQAKNFFQKAYFEIDGKQLLLRINEREGLVLPWDKIQKIHKEKDCYLIIINRVQFLHLPFDIFKTETDLKFVESIFKKKNLLKDYFSLKDIFKRKSD